MKTTCWITLLGALACAGGWMSPAFAQPAPAAPRAAAPPAAPVPPPAPPAPAAGAAATELEARLADAHRRLEDAAREVAELSLRAPAGGHGLVFAGESPRRAIIGVQVDPASGRDGARIAQVSPGGPADAAGLRAGDVLQSIGGTDLRNRDDPARALVERMAQVQPDQALRATVLRAGKAREVQLVARRSPVAFAATRVAPFEVPLPPLPDGPPQLAWLGDGPAVAGLELATVTPGLGRYFGTDQGVLVVRAPRRSEWRLEDGDVILAIDGREPTSGAHATRILRSYQRGETLKLRVMRQRRPLELSVEVPEPDRQAARRIRMLALPAGGPGGETPTEIVVGPSVAPDAGFGGAASPARPAPQ